MQRGQTDAQVTTDTTAALPPDAVDRDDDESLESSRGVRFLSSDVPDPSAMPPTTP